MVIPVGNVTAETELTYEYGVRSHTKKKTTASTAAPRVPKGATPTLASDDKAAPTTPEVPPLTVNGKPHLPFQLQIEYTGRDGSRCMRVISEARPVTRDRSEAERSE